MSRERGLRFGDDLRMITTGIFISYRREDSGAYAGRLSDWLVEHFGKQRIFMDRATLKVGVDFVTQIETAIASCQVCLAVIGKQWLTIQDQEGKQRLTKSDDFVRAEIELALNRGIPVIPLLVGGAKMPSETDLPMELVALARRHAFEINDASFPDDMNRLMQALEEYVTTQKKTEKPRSMIRSAWIISLSLVGIALGTSFKWLFPSVEITTELGVLLVLMSSLVVWATHRVWQVLKGRWL